MSNKQIPEDRALRDAKPMDVIAYPAITPHRKRQPAELGGVSSVPAPLARPSCDLSLT